VVARKPGVKVRVGLRKAVRRKEIIGKFKGPWGKGPAVRRASLHAKTHQVDFQETTRQPLNTLPREGYSIWGGRL